MQHTFLEINSIESIERPEYKSSLFAFTGFYSSTFIYSHFSTKIKFLYCLLSSVALWGSPMVETEGNIFEFQVCRLLENAFFMDFRVLWGVLKKS